MKRIGIVALALATVVTIGCNKRDVATNSSGNPDAVGTSGASDQNKVPKKDVDFVQDMTVANMAEVELGKLAVERSSNSEVKKFGQLMIDDHTKLGDSLKTLSAQYSIQVPNQLDDKHATLRDKLAKYQGAEFDREYMDAMIDGHKDVAGKLESRIDKASLAQWKTEMEDRLHGKKTQEQGQLIAVLPEKSDNPATMSINQWAAEGYPIVEAHLEAAKTLDDAVKARKTN